MVGWGDHAATCGSLFVEEPVTIHYRVAGVGGGAAFSGGGGQIESRRGSADGDAIESGGCGLRRCNGSQSS